MMHRIQAFLADETGPTTVEYAVILMLIFLAVIGTVQIIGSSLFGSFSDSGEKIEQAIN